LLEEVAVTVVLVAVVMVVVGAEVLAGLQALVKVVALA
jgi:hypothetical protein